MDTATSNVSKISVIVSVMDRARSSLELDLLGWACDHWPEPVDAVLARWGDWEFEKKCIGSIFRRVAAAAPAWFYATCSERPREVVALAPYIKSIPGASLGWDPSWGDVPGRQGWVDYVKAIRASEGM
jgi:hypothetical protein